MEVAAPGICEYAEAMESLRKITPLEMFLGFASVGLRGFGGVMPFIYDEVVERRKWITREDFAELIALGQVLPGANITNFASMFGYRLAGWRGAVASVCGLLGPPSVVIVVLYYFYRGFSHQPVVQGALHGIMAVAAALIFVTGVKMLSSPRVGRGLSLLFAAAALLGVGIFRLPLVGVLLALGPLLFCLHWRLSRSQK